MGVGGVTQIGMTAAWNGSNEGETKAVEKWSIAFLQPGLPGFGEGMGQRDWVEYRQGGRVVRGGKGLTKGGHADGQAWSLAVIGGGGGTGLADAECGRLEGWNG